MCDFCNNPNTKTVDYIIESKNSKIVICPNCVAENIKPLVIPVGYYKSEITGVDGAVKICNAAQCSMPYYVTPDEAIRLLGHALLPFEVVGLLKNGVHNLNEFELHDDFYMADTHFAVNPYDEKQYIKDLTEYKKSANLPFKERGKINYHIKFLQGKV